MEGAVQPFTLTIDQARQFSGLGKTTLYSAIKAGDLPSRIVAGRRLILRADLENYLTVVAP